MKLEQARKIKIKIVEILVRLVFLGVFILNQFGYVPVKLLNVNLSI